jgi:hypothetical protein
MTLSDLRAVTTPQMVKMSPRAWATVAPVSVPAFVTTASASRLDLALLSIRHPLEPPDQAAAAMGVQSPVHNLFRGLAAGTTMAFE